MITINLGTIEYYDSDLNQFKYEEGGIVRFEYSLKVLYTWEAKWRKPFLHGERTNEELVDFYMTMALDPIHERFMTEDVMMTLSEYIGETHTATTFSSHQDGQNDGNNFSTGKTYTAEELYALMIMSNIPLEFENRNLNRLLVILRIISAYNSPPKKMSTEDIYKQNRMLNEQRKAQLKTKG
jgi:hypothetical protein